MKVLFLHGGPGMHSETEKKLLEPLFSRANLDITFWNEPSYLRQLSLLPPSSERAFARTLETAELQLNLLFAESGLSISADEENQEKVHVVGHSFGAILALLLAARNPEKVGLLTLLTPATQLLSAFKNVMSQAASAAEKSGNGEVAQSLRNYLNTPSLADSQTVKGMELAFFQPPTLSYYFKNEKALEEWGAVCSQPGLGVDVQAYGEVLKDGAGMIESLAQLSLPIPTQLIFGRHDKVVLSDLETPFLKQITHVEQIHFIEDAAHFVQLESPEQVTYLVAEFHFAHQGVSSGLTLSDMLAESQTSKGASAQSASI
ncbi:alpha/beta hydrolase [bacterium]|jgi:pimeloyl-ACP methyl ester carboxylesterase|nr:alpha/beta hydrolase [bacterium]